MLDFNTIINAALASVVEQITEQVTKAVTEKVSTQIVDQVINKLVNDPTFSEMMATAVTEHVDLDAIGKGLLDDRRFIRAVVDDSAMAEVIEDAVGKNLDYSQIADGLMEERDFIQSIADELNKCEDYATASSMEEALEEMRKSIEEENERYACNNDSRLDDIEKMLGEHGEELKQMTHIKEFNADIIQSAARHLINV